MKENGRCEATERMGKSYRRCTLRKDQKHEIHVLGNWSLEALFESVRAPNSKAEEIKAKDEIRKLLAERKILVKLAQDVARDERHWAVTDVADRAENAADLSRAVLSFFGTEEDDCPEKCKDCEDHARETGNDEEA